MKKLWLPIVVVVYASPDGGLSGGPGPRSRQRRLEIIGFSTLARIL